MISLWTLIRVSKIFLCEKLTIKHWIDNQFYSIAISRIVHCYSIGQSNTCADTRKWEKLKKTRWSFVLWNNVFRDKQCNVWPSMFFDSCLNITIADCSRCYQLKKTIIQLIHAIFKLSLELMFNKLIQV